VSTSGPPTGAGGSLYDDDLGQGMGRDFHQVSCPLINISSFRTRLLINVFYAGAKERLAPLRS
jgi:hypothetical protein